MLRFLFWLAGVGTTAKVASSGNGTRLAKHLLRKTAHKFLAKGLRKL